MRPILPIALLAASLCSVCLAQQPPNPTQASEQTPVATLHVNASLVQVPVLVLYPTHDLVATSIAPDRFSISFDRGPFIRTANTRMEGDDPIDLAIVLDARGAQTSLLPTLDQDIANLVPTELHPQDHVSIYAMTCGSIRSVVRVPASDSAHLKTAVDSALTDWTNRRAGKDKSPCGDIAPIWDLLAYAANGLSNASGRRVILAFTNGDDKKSTHTWDFVYNYAQTLGVTIFALNADTGTTRFNAGPSSTPAPPSCATCMSSGPSAGTGGFSTSNSGDTSPFVSSAAFDPHDMVVSALAAANRHEPVFRLTDVCELSGGVELRIDRNDPVPTLKRAVEMVRNRYIIDFPLGLATAGHHELRVNIDREKFFIRPAGNGIPVSNPAQQPAPGAIQPGAAPTPQLASAPQPRILDTTHTRGPTGAAAPPTPAAPQLAAEQPPAPSQPAPQPVAKPVATPRPPTPPTIRVDTNLTVVDITVVDKQGHPVHGLKQSDFIIKEDGESQSIKNFDEFGAANPPAQSASGLPPGLNQPTNAVGPINIILLDDVSTGMGWQPAPENIIRSRIESTSYLKNMPPGTQIAILKLTDKLRIVQNVTTDRNVLLAAINKVAYEPLVGTNVHSDNPSLVEQCLASNTQSVDILNGFNEIAAFVSGIKGRKNLIWFTTGSPWLTNWQQYRKTPCLQNFTPQLQQTYTVLTAAHVAIYTIDPRGLGSNPFGPDGEGEGPIGPNAQGPNGEITAASLRAEFLTGKAEAASALDFTEATGGIAYYNRNDIDAALGEAINAGSSYYSLTYVPPLVGYDGKFHTINVTLKSEAARPGLHLQYRKGYTSLELPRLTSSTAASADKSKASKSPKP